MIAARPAPDRCACDGTADAELPDQSVDELAPACYALRDRQRRHPHGGRRHGHARDGRRGGPAHAEPPGQAQQLHAANACQPARGDDRDRARPGDPSRGAIGRGTRLLRRSGPRRPLVRAGRDDRSRRTDRGQLQSADPQAAGTAQTGDRQGARHRRRGRREPGPGLRPGGGGALGILPAGVRQHRPAPRLGRHLAAAACGRQRPCARAGDARREAAGGNGGALGDDLEVRRRCCA